MEESAAKPTWRGGLHALASLAMLPLAVGLLNAARSNRARVAVVIYLLGVSAMFSVSALYHRGHWNTKAHNVLQKVDHSTIFLAIAGTYTPISVLALHGGARTLLLSVVWIGALVGISLQWIPVARSRVLTALVYVVVGWSAVLVFGKLRDGLTTEAFVLVFLGGLAYTAGSVVYATKRPDPWPRTFGFHEVFHACTVIAAASHALAVYLTLRHSR